MQGKRESKRHKFGGVKFCKAEQVGNCFVNPKTENEVFFQYVNYIICGFDFRNTEAVVRRYTSEQVFLKFRNVHRKISVLGFLFNKYLDLKACSFIKKRLQHRCFPVKFAKILSTPFFAKHIRSLLLEISYELSLYYI